MIASPSDASRLNAPREMQKIQDRLRKALQRNKFDIVFEFAQPYTLLDVIEDEKPEIVHFCGHGTEEGIVLQSESGDASRLIPTNVLKEVFERTENYVKCVLLNACYSEIHAYALSEHIRYTIGMEGEIFDRAAIAFANAFYKDIGSGRSIEDAFKRGYVASRLVNPDEVPKLFKKDSKTLISLCSDSCLRTVAALKNTLTKTKRRAILLLAAALFGAFLVIVVGGRITYQPDTATADSPPDIEQPVSTGRGISNGEQLLLSETVYSNQKNKDFALQGTQAFKRGAYEEAERLFSRAIAENQNNPEPYIYRNNAIARQQRTTGQSRDYTVIAVAVPASGSRGYRAEEMLRGIADAQSCFNYSAVSGCLPQSQQSLLEVKVIDDGNDKVIASDEALKVSQDDAVLGIVGHYASDVTLNTLSKYKYEGEAIPVISPGSTSSKIESDRFFRTITSTEQLGSRLADYAKDQNITKVFGFSDSSDEYSSTSWDDFFKALGDQNIAHERIPISAPMTVINEKISEIKDDRTFAAAIFPPSTLTENFASSQEGDERTSVIAEAITSQSNNLLLGGNALYRTETKGRSYEGMVLAIPWFSEAFSNESYAERAGNKWGGQVSWITAGSYDAVQVFMHALSQVDTAALVSNTEIRERLPDEIRSIQLAAEYTSGAQTVEFPEGSDEPSREPFLVHVVQQNGKYNFQEIAE